MMKTPVQPGPGLAPGLLRRTFRNHWLGISLAWLLASALLMTWAIKAIPPTYRAASLLRVDPSTMNLYNQPDQTPNLEAYVHTVVQLLTSANVLTAAGTSSMAGRLPRIQDSKDVVLDLRRAIQVVVLPRTYIVEVSMTSPSPIEAATLVNAVVGAFHDSNVEWSDGMTRNQIKSLEVHLSELKNQSNELERRWKDLVSRGEEVERARPSRLVNADHRARIEEKLIEGELRRFQASAEIEALREVGAKDPARFLELETQVKASQILERDLRARLDSSGGADLTRKSATDEVEIALLRKQLEDLHAKQETVNRRLEEIRFQSKGENRVRIVETAVAPGKPVRSGYRPWLLGAIPFVTFLAVLGLFSGIENRHGGPIRTAPIAPPSEIPFE